MNFQFVISPSQIHTHLYKFITTGLSKFENNPQNKLNINTISLTNIYSRINYTLYQHYCKQTPYHK